MTIVLMLAIRSLGGHSISRRGQYKVETFEMEVLNLIHLV